MKKLLQWVGIIFVGFVALGVVVGANKSPRQTGSEATVRVQQSAEQSEANSAEAEPAKVEGLTGPQNNAVRSAKQYLRMQGFSRNGLIQQLSSSAGDGYTVEDATVAVDSLNVDWNEEAVKSAKQYLNMQGFSCNGLIHQLSSDAGDKYTVSQATYGAKQAGACS